MYPHMFDKKYISFTFQPKRDANGVSPQLIETRIAVHPSNANSETIQGLQKEWLDILVREGYIKNHTQARLFNTGIM